MLRIIFFYGIFHFFIVGLSGQSIILDDRFGDWESALHIFSDSEGDVLPGNVDFTDIRMSNDDERLYIFFNTHKQINIQSDNNITLYLDIDSDVTTGIRVGGMGADLVYEFGRRRGTYYAGSFQFNLGHIIIGLVTSPTVTSDKFELCLLRKFKLGNTEYNIENQVRMVLADNTFQGDRAPDSDGYYEYSLRSVQDNDIRHINLEKEDNKAIRVLAYNVLRDNFHDPEMFPAYSRILKAIQPDIIGFSEIYNNSPDLTASVVERILPSPSGKMWYHSGAGPDIQLISKYPILRTRAIDGNGAFLLDIGDGKNILVLVTHLPCCENDEGRQREVDNIMSFLRGIRFGISSFNVPLGTPYIIMGDKNFVGDSGQLTTLITGDISNNNDNGIDFRPDWDNTNLSDAVPVTTGLPMTFTWPGTNSSFGAGRLDYIIYSDSELLLKKSFVLWTPGLSDIELSQYNLFKNDIPLVSDHLPVVADFLPGRQVSVLKDDNDEFYPFSIRRDGQGWEVNTEIQGLIRIMDISGKTWMEKTTTTEDRRLIFYPETAGIYVVMFYTGGMMYSLKIWH